MKASFTLAMFAIGVAAALAADVKPSTPPPAHAPAASQTRVTVISDGDTWVSMTNVKMPTRSKTMTFSLAPGDYEVVGRRKGYRDVRKSLHVPSDGPPITLSVICTESVQ